MPFPHTTAGYVARVSREVPFPAEPKARHLGKDMPIKQAEHTGSSFAWTSGHRTVRPRRLDGRLPAKP